ncbi:Kef-type potassium/proton antiporter (CPA2 family) [Orbus hercynius]|uniref:Kef-type potassium/proton antiporter (CPA2 family) n=1 Tax=Orbus hercynius TaxID=593135 RepID=A0A495REY6_9GAMM|nr:Kef-type potassium/proton antiporter (CPA2 family) [Orbus hercynius]
MHDTGPLLAAIIGGIVLAAILGMLADRLRVSPLVGYLIAGIIFGPATPGYVADTAIISQLAEIGVILLMFAVGLHFSLKDLMAVKLIAIPGAVVQIAVATLLGMGLSSILGWSMTTGLVFGLCLSTASTVVLLRALEERDLIESKRGRIAIGWLIVEDLAMVLTLVLLPPIVTMLGDNADVNVWNVLTEIAKTIGLVIVFIALMIVVGRRVIPWLLAKSASTGSEELFTLSVLAIALGIALAAVQLFGASFALGAFFAGMALTESELSHRAAKNILPLKDAFAVLFFVSVGMLFDPHILIEHPLATLSTVVIIIFGKSIAAYFIVRIFGHTKRTALTISASLAQIGEFAFILAALGKVLGVFPNEAYSLILAGAIISIVINPFIFNLIERYLAKTESIVDKIIDPIAVINQQVPKGLTDHAILVGHGRLGSTIAKQLKIRHIPFVAVDNSLTLVEQLRHDDIAAVFGNASKPETLELAQLDTAKWLIISTPNGYEAGEICSQARKVRPDLAIYVRAFYDDEAEYIAEHGATGVITGENEIAKHILSLMQLNPSDETDKDIESVEPIEKEKKIDIPVHANLPAGEGSPIE